MYMSCSICITHWSQTLTGHLRVSPSPPSGLFPFLNSRDPYSSISLLSFSNRPQSQRGGAFYDYTARYGAIWDEDRTTLRQSILKKSLSLDNDLDLVEKLGLTPLLDLPLIALSNGQTRRARILEAILPKPEILLLDEPLTGLDTSFRPIVLSLLRSRHIARSPRVILGLRLQDPIPDWITHVAFVKDDTITTGTKDVVLKLITGTASASSTNAPAPASDVLATSQSKEKTGRVLVQMKNVCVHYDDRKVLDNINWEIRAGDIWHLQGPNGSGKTTLLAILTGDHPQSYTQLPPSSLSIFSRPRPSIPTAYLRTRIGAVSPELAAAFPRSTSSGMNVWEVVGTGFDGVFVALGKAHVGVGLDGVLSDEEERWRLNRVWDILNKLGPHTWDKHEVENEEEESLATTPQAFAQRPFASLTAGEQAIVLLMRALVGRTPLLLLDEPWAGMDSGMVASARRVLREEVVDGRSDGERPAVVVVGHWEEEVPWTVMEGLRRFRLETGRGQEVL